MLIFSIIGTLIGAGFASGQEMYLFFYKYGLNGILGLILCSTLISLVIYKTFLIIHTKQITNYDGFLKEVFCSDKLSKASNIIVNAFLLITFYIMISGFGAYFQQQFNIPSIIGAIILASLCFIVLIKDIEGVKNVNSIVVPVLILVILIIGSTSIKNIFSRSSVVEFVSTNKLKWILEAIVYCSYNMILVIPVLVNLGKFIKSKRQIKVVSIISGVIVFALAISIFFILSNINADYSKIEMPAVFVIDNNFPQFSGIYGIVILLSIFSTAISIGISFLKNITKDKKSYPQIVAIMCISGVLISNFGFSNLVKMLFPVFGYLGIVWIYSILKSKII